MLSDALFIVFVSLVVIYAEFKMTKYNFGKSCNGVGAIPLVLRGMALSPMQHRVLVPWLCRVFVGVKDRWHDYLVTYLRIKQVGVVFALSAAWFYFGAVGVDPHLGVVTLALFFIWASLYDYADIYYEIGFLCVAFTVIQYNPVWALCVLVPVVILAALNKETGVIIPIVSVLSLGVIDGTILCLAFISSYMVPRLVYGDRERYCEWFMVKRNIRAIKDTTIIPLVYNEYVSFAIILLSGAVLYTISWPWSYTEFILMAVSVALLIPSMWCEVRVFAPITLALIPMALRGL